MKKLLKGIFKEKENWKDIHEDFVKKNQRRKTYQQIWEEKDLTYQDAQEWIKIGFEPDDWDEVKEWKRQGLKLSTAKSWVEVGIKNYKEEVKEWKRHNFTPQEAKSWIDIGLNKNDAEFAAYLRGKNHQPNQNLKLKQLRNDWTTQRWLDKNYPKSQRDEIKKLDIFKENLTGALDLNDFVNLEELDCSDNQLTSLKLDNCSKLKKINCSKNNLKQDLSLFSCLINLEELWISDTDIDSGLEYLPKSVKEFFIV